VPFLSDEALDDEARPPDGAAQALSREVRPLDQITLLDQVTLAGRTASSRVVFGPHETNLGADRALSARHVAYYARRAAGGAGVIVTEVASVHDGDWPYERAPLAADCRDGWRQIARACHRSGALLLAGLGHTGLQGSSAYSQRELWAPSGFTDVVSRETPMIMEQPQIDAVVRGFAAAAAAAVESGADGVEIDAGAGALLRQFHSGLTNQRRDGYGPGADEGTAAGDTDAHGPGCLALTLAVLSAVRAVIGREHVLALRLSCDELAPWAGITPQVGAEQAAALAPRLDLLTVVRGGPYSGSGYRPDAHTAPMFNIKLAAAVRVTVNGTVPVVLQGSVVDVAAAQAALATGAADLVEMTRAQIADAELVAKLRAGHGERIRPCILCNQTCRVRDPRNPVVTCVADPRSGHETIDPPTEPRERAGTFGVVGAGGAGMAGWAARAGGSGMAGGAEVSEVAVGAGGADSGEITAGAGGTDAAVGGSAGRREVLVVGGGPAGLEAARVAATRRHAVRVAERSGRLGGTLRAAAVGPARERMARLADWLEAECRRLAVRLDTDTEITAADLDTARAAGTEVILATGSRPAGSVDAGAVDAGAVDSVTVEGGVIEGGVIEGEVIEAERGEAERTVTVDALSALSGADALSGAGSLVVHDPVGGPVGVAVAEWLVATGRPGRRVSIVSPDPVIGTQLSLTGDLADANVRLQRAGVTRELRARLREAGGGTALLEDVWTGAQRRIDCAVLIDCGHRLPDEELYRQRPGTRRVGDCVAPRTVHEAVLEGRRAAQDIGAAEQSAADREPAELSVL
jgi:2,4-dienoyl-CoA reductase-like NADH-dependent reductase (Old Yellow Enzyme family)